MLAPKLAIDTYAEAYNQANPVGFTETVFAGPNGAVNFGSQGGSVNVDNNVPPTVDEPQNPIDSNDKSFSRQIDIPSVLGVPLTNQTDTRVFDKTLDRAQPIDATLLNNPAVDGFQTVMTQQASPLGANFAGSSIVASGHDPAAFYSQQPVMSPSQDTTTQDTTAQPSQSWLDWLTTTAGGNSIKGEVTVIIVGLILLTVGIYALTR